MASLLRTQVVLITAFECWKYMSKTLGWSCPATDFTNEPVAVKLMVAFKTTSFAAIGLLLG